MARESLGEFEQLVMLAILRLGEDVYGVPVVEEIERRTGRGVSRAAVYIALRRLENKGLVSSHMADPTPERGGRAKRFFRVEPDGIDLLRDSRLALLSMWQDLEPVLGGR
ncbi:MAG: helix-turn-helix transcriptional regulator [Gemmatimonadota bacterium]|nr:MAG: helix-turn-helix transcriptional regulator [Gemmatimonadota bacterium]